MSLDTVLKIGQIFRSSPGGLRYHRYFKSIADEIELIKRNKNDSGGPINTTVYKLPVKEVGDKFEFLFDELDVITDEDKIATLLYLNFKTSDKDKEKKYIYGDIIYSASKDNKGEFKEGGNYRRPNSKRSDGSFVRGNSEVSELTKSNNVIRQFRECFEKNIKKIEDDILTRNSSVAIHFAFPDGRDWFDQYDAQNLLKELLLSAFVIEANSSGRKVFALSKTLFKTIKTPIFDRSEKRFKDPDGVGGVTPGFSNKAAYKLRAFETKDEIFDLMFAIDFAETSKISVGSDVGIVVLPSGKNLTINSLASFIGKRSTLDDEEIEEEAIVLNNEPLETESDSFFAPLIKNSFEDEVEFDLVFFKPKSLAAPSVDLVEISSIRKSHLRDVHHNIQEVRLAMQTEIKNLFPKAGHFNFNLRNCFLEILTNKTRSEKKYQSHLLKVLPQIYLDTYYEDPLILPAFIERSEFNIRNEGKFNYNWFKFNFLFLVHLQKSKPYQAMTESKSYHVGRFLGIMARPFAAWRNDCPIKSFEKNYVGNLTRRVAYLDDLIKFFNFLNEKLLIHERLRFDQQEASRQLAQELAQLPSGKYNKHECALGFFETYFEKVKSKTPE